MAEPTEERWARQGKVMIAGHGTQRKAINTWAATTTADTLTLVTRNLLMMVPGVLLIVRILSGASVISGLVTNVIQVRVNTLESFSVNILFYCKNFISLGSGQEPNNFSLSSVVWLQWYFKTVIKLSKSLWVTRSPNKLYQAKTGPIRVNVWETEIRLGGPGGPIKSLDLNPRSVHMKRWVKFIKTGWDLVIWIERD